MSRGHDRRHPRPDGFPRVSGDEPITQAVARDVLGFSPRERG